LPVRGNPMISRATVPPAQRVPSSVLPPSFLLYQAARGMHHGAAQLQPHLRQQVLIMGKESGEPAPCPQTPARLSYLQSSCPVGHSHSTPVASLQLSARSRWPLSPSHYPLKDSPWTSPPWGVSPWVLSYANLTLPEAFPQYQAHHTDIDLLVLQT
jgi:hypothetical protein